MIGGIDPNTKKWTSKAVCFKSLTSYLKLYKKGDLHPEELDDLPFKLVGPSVFYFPDEK